MIPSSRSFITCLAAVASPAAFLRTGTFHKQNAAPSIIRVTRRRNSTETTGVKKTSLYDVHVRQGARFVPFAGWTMPVVYKDQTHMESHLHTRSAASLFDVSHMLQTRWVGKHRHDFIEHLTVADVKNLPVGHASLSVFTNKEGGIIDDTIISQQEDSLYVVSNAGCAEKDLKHIREELRQWKKKGKDVDVNVIEDHSLIALQGPKAADVLTSATSQDLSKFAFMTGRFMSINGIPCHVARSGYTGEDGFEISVPHKDAAELTNTFLENPNVKMAGLAARDSLRLEAGMCLYSHDLNEEISPVEAGLTWTIAKRRRLEGGFLGAGKILAQIKDGVNKRRIGLTVQGAPAREHAKIFDATGNKEIGVITSGTFSPSLKVNIAMGYVESSHYKTGTQLKVQVRSKLQDAVVVKMPFVPSSYHKL